MITIEEISIGTAWLKAFEQTSKNRGSKKPMSVTFSQAEGVDSFNKATETSPNYAIPYYNRAFIKMKLKDYNGAIIDFNKAIELNPKSVFSYYYINAYHNRANSKYLLKDYKGAIIDFSKAIEHKPKFATAYYKRGICKINLK